MRYPSVLFDRSGSPLEVAERGEAPFLADLNLDRVLGSMTADREEYDLEPFFYAPLCDVAAVRYRHEVVRDLEKCAVSESVKAFARKMRSMREHLAQAEKLRYRYQKESWFLDAVEIYCEAVRSLAGELARPEVSSRGLRALGGYLEGYTGSDGFRALAAETLALKESLAGVRYSGHIRESRVRVGAYCREADYSADVEETFAKFNQGAAKDHRVKFPNSPDMDHVEARILGLVAKMHPEVFGALDEYCARHCGFLDGAVGAFDREVQFYLAYLEYIGRFKAAGLPFCYPRVSARSKEVFAEGAFDLALAGRLVHEGSAVVRNDFCLNDPERILVVTGPNQGGKTTFARMFGQLHHLAGLGLPVPAKEARLSLPDRIFTHFEREESLATLKGKLEDELVRVHDILQRATGNSVLIMNESFTSTTLEDALVLGTAVMRQVMARGLLCVYVTFVDELASLGESTVSMAATVVPEDPAQRTYEVVRKPADGLAYAAAIAEKYGLTYERLKERLAS